MNKPAMLAYVEDYSRVFEAATDEEDEWLSRDILQRAMLKLMRYINKVDDEDVRQIQAYWEWLEEDQHRKWQIREEERRAALTPEQREREDVRQRMFEDLSKAMKPMGEAYILSTIFGLVPDKMGVE